MSNGETWAQFEIEKGIAYIQHLFEQLLVMTRYSLLFNVSLAAAAGFLIQQTEGNILANRPLASVAIFLCFISVIFNIGARRAHNSSWEMIETVKAYLMELEDKLRKTGEQKAFGYELVTRIGKKFYPVARFSTRWWTQWFYAGLIFGWGSLFIALTSAIAGCEWMVSLINAS